MIIKDKFHAFFICPKFDVLRENYLSLWYTQGDSRPEFFRLMQETNPDIKKLCIFVNGILKINITKTRLFKYIENFTSKNCKFKIKNSDLFRFSALNIDCGYSLEPRRF